jgi:hypothetical protein
MVMEARRRGLRRYPPPAAQTLRSRHSETPSPSLISLLTITRSSSPLVEKGGDVGTDTELDLQPDCGIAGGELPKQRGQRVEIEILRRPDADEAAAVAAEAMLCFLI